MPPAAIRTSRRSFTLLPSLLMRERRWAPRLTARRTVFSLLTHWTSVRIRCRAGEAAPTPVTDVMARTQRPLEAGVLQEASHDPAWKTIPSWFLLPTQDRVIGTDAERAMAVRAGSQIVEVRASHAVLVSQPTKVTKLIEEV